MKTWNVCVEFGPFSVEYRVTNARTRQSAVNKVRKQILEEQRKTGYSRHFMISESAVIECIPEQQEKIERIINETLLNRQTEWNAFTLKLAEMLAEGPVRAVTRNGTQVTMYNFVRHDELEYFVGVSTLYSQLEWYIDGASLNRPELDLIEIAVVVK